MGSGSDCLDLEAAHARQNSKNENLLAGHLTLALQASGLSVPQMAPNVRHDDLVLALPRREMNGNAGVGRFHSDREVFLEQHRDIFAKEGIFVSPGVFCRIG